ncbi:MAG: DNA repair protein RecN [Gemmatimonadetes bacterium]|nr:DNA repair protein RecN [Gemmatimonadota bacterium]
MLIELRIRDYAVIDTLTLQLGPGLNALTGETGAGKSIIVGALSLLLGERASSEDVRVGAERAVVEGVFDVEGRADLLARLDDLGLQAEDGLLILRREVQAAGRNRAWVNGSPATARVVGLLGSALVDLHGQHEHQTLLHRSAQRDILDAYAEATGLATDVRRLHREWADARDALEARRARARELASRADFLRFQLAEIADAEVEPGEEDTLEVQARRLEHARELAEGAYRLHAELYDGEGALSDRLAEARSLAERLRRVDPSLAEVADGVEAAYHAVVEAGRAAGSYADGVEQDPRDLERVQERQHRLFRLKQKYGPGLDDVVATGKRLAGEVAELDAADRDVSDLEVRRDRARDALHVTAARLTSAREAAGTRLARDVEAVLPRLGMPSAIMRIALLPTDEPGAGGAEDVEFQVSLNPGFEPRPLRRVASGGELSRVMLALKSLLARVDRVPTLVFDEIDAGIGGVVATGVARTLAEVAADHQVFVITHLPQLASRAGAHLLVRKGESDGLAVTSVAELRGDDRVVEIARMLGGDPESDASREHARELLAAG